MRIACFSDRYKLTCISGKTEFPMRKKLRYGVRIPGKALNLPPGYLSACALRRMINIFEF